MVRQRALGARRGARGSPAASAEPGLHGLNPLLDFGRRRGQSRRDEGLAASPAWSSSGLESGGAALGSSARGPPSRSQSRGERERAVSIAGGGGFAAHGCPFGPHASLWSNRTARSALLILGPSRPAPPDLDQGADTSRDQDLAASSSSTGRRRGRRARRARAGSLMLVADCCRIVGRRVLTMDDGVQPGCRPGRGTAAGSRGGRGMGAGKPSRLSRFRGPEAGKYNAAGPPAGMP